MRVDYLLLPSAIAPSPSTPFQEITDPNLRMKQTIRAIKNWLRIADRLAFQIIVGDNTGHAKHLAREFKSRKVDPQKIRFLDLDQPSKDDIARGKGACETRALIEMLSDTQLSQDSIIAKSNARYFTTNAVSLIKALSDDFDFAGWPYPRMNLIDTTFFLGRTSFLKNILPEIYIKTDDRSGIFVEKLYATKTLFQSNCEFERLAYQPAIFGQSGSTGERRSILSEARVVSIVIRLRESTLSMLKMFRKKKGLFSVRKIAKFRTLDLE